MQHQKIEELILNKNVRRLLKKTAEIHTFE
jgi:hypothetical protein